VTPPPAGSLDDLRIRFGHHPPRNRQEAQEHERVRGYFWELVCLLHGAVPPGPQRDLMWTHLEEAQMRANAAIAIPRATSDIGVSPSR
jgi:hypothetical protein